MLATFYGNRFIGQYTLQMIQQLLCLPRSKVRICISKLPDQRTLLFFDVRSICGLLIQIHNRFHQLFPFIIVDSQRRDPFFFPAPPVENKQKSQACFVWVGGVIEVSTKFSSVLFTFEVVFRRYYPDQTDLAERLQQYNLRKTKPNSSSLLPYCWCRKMKKRSPVKESMLGSDP